MSRPIVVPVVSGKGGSGKTTISVGIAKEFAKRGYKVALIDMDVKGPNLLSKLNRGVVPKMEIKNNQLVAFRVPGYDNFSAFSTELYMDDDGGIALDSEGIKTFMNSVFVVTDWGFEPDVYVCDMDPAASDTLDVITKLFKKKSIKGVIVSTPDKLSIDNTLRSVDVCRSKDVPLVGYITNMAYFECNVCNTHHFLFGDPDDVSIFNKRFGLTLIGEIKLGDIDYNYSFKRTMKSAFCVIVNGPKGVCD